MPDRPHASACRALVVYVAVLNEGISREQELAHLRLLPGQQDLPPEVLHDHFVRLRLGNCTLKWERHSEYTRYSIVQSLPEDAGLEAENPPLDALAIDPDWLAAIPGRTITAIKLAMVIGDIANAPEAARRGQRWLGGRSVVASIMGTYGHSIAVTSFRLREDGFEHMLVIAPERTTETRAGRISQRLLELETYRMMALRGLPAAKALSPMLAEAESRLAEITARLENKAATDQELLDTLVALAARVERATAENQYRFAATQAYDAIVSQRIQELREKPISGTQTISEFMQRRLSPAIQTVAATAQRLSGLSQQHRAHQRAAAHPRRHRHRVAEPAAAGAAHPRPGPAAAHADDGGGAVDRGDLVLRDEPDLLRRQGGQGRRRADQPGAGRRRADPGGAVGRVAHQPAHPREAPRRARSLKRRRPTIAGPNLSRPTPRHEETRR